MSLFTEKSDKATLLIIDPQNDFHEGGSLAVKGAVEDSTRTAELIRNNMDKFEKIIVSLDSHNPGHIANSSFWSSVEDDADGSKGTGPAPFTLILHEDIVNGKWHPRDSSKKALCEEYAKNLEAKGRFKLIIWPDHCIIGTEGQKVVPVLQEALDAWADSNPSNRVSYVNKGMNIDTEMYSAIAAEVPIDEETAANVGLLQELSHANKLIVCGQALSHCVNYTTRDIVSNWEEINKPREHMYILKDACSPVGGFEVAGETFLNDMQNKGVNITTTDQVFGGKKDQEFGCFEKLSCF